jgi:hypothetical protein
LTDVNLISYRDRTVASTPQETEATYIGATVTMGAQQKSVLKRDSAVYYYLAVALALAVDSAFFVRLMYVEGRIKERESRRESRHSEKPTTLTSVATCSQASHFEGDPFGERAKVSESVHLANTEDEALNEPRRTTGIEKKTNERKTEKLERNRVNDEQVIGSDPVSSLAVFDEGATTNVKSKKRSAKVNKGKRVTRVKVSDGEGPKEGFSDQGKSVASVQAETEVKTTTEGGKTKPSKMLTKAKAGKVKE